MALRRSLEDSEQFFFFFFFFFVSLLFVVCFSRVFAEDQNPFLAIDKGKVLQEKRIFNETPVKVHACVQLITKIMFLLMRGESFTKIEAEDLFFAVTKLFQSQDMVLRRMTYLVLREIANTKLVDSVLIIIASLSKDMMSPVENYRANSIRVLCGILTDINMLGQGSRVIKQSIVDQQPYVASAAIVSGYHLLQSGNPTNLDVVKRWSTEISDALNRYLETFCGVFVFSFSVLIFLCFLFFRF